MDHDKVILPGGERHGVDIPQGQLTAQDLLGLALEVQILENNYFSIFVGK